MHTTERIILDVDISDLVVSPRGWWRDRNIQIEDWSGTVCVQYATVEAAQQDKVENWAEAKESLGNEYYAHYSQDSPKWRFVQIEGRWATFAPVR